MLVLSASVSSRYGSRARYLFHRRAWLMRLARPAHRERLAVLAVRTLEVPFGESPSGPRATCLCRYACAYGTCTFPVDLLSRRRQDRVFQSAMLRLPRPLIAGSVVLLGATDVARRRKQPHRRPELASSYGAAFARPRLAVPCHTVTQRLTRSQDDIVPYRTRRSGTVMARIAPNRAVLSCTEVHEPERLRSET
jgi:hypothetical protein